MTSLFVLVASHALVMAALFLVLLVEVIHRGRER